MLKSKNKSNNPKPKKIGMSGPIDIHSQEIIEKQATINIGTLGHVGHGKTTLVRGITTIDTLRHDSEKKRNITIKLGYANFKIFQCEQCPKPQCFQSFPSNKNNAQCNECSRPMKLVRHFSFVDCPGHECLLATMLNGAAIMDCALLIIAANDKVPQPQTAQHLASAEIMGLQNIFTVQTKVDLLSDPSQIRENYEEIKKFTQGTSAQQSPVIPVTPRTSHQDAINLDVILQYLVEKVPLPPRDVKSPPYMNVVRSFDVNKPGFEINQLTGGVAGGSLRRGFLRVGQDIEIRPGLIINERNGKYRCIPLITKVESLYSEKNSLDIAVPGGLIAVGTTLDPTLTKGDRLVGHVIGEPGKLPPIFIQLELTVHLMKKFESKGEDAHEDMKIEKLKKGEILMFNIGSSSTKGVVIAVKGSKAKIDLRKPTCLELGEKISISRQYSSRFKLIGFGKFEYGEPLNIHDSPDNNHNSH